MKRYIRSSQGVNNSFYQDALAFLERDPKFVRTLGQLLDQLKDHLGLTSGSYDRLIYSSRFLGSVRSSIVQHIQENTDYKDDVKSSVILVVDPHARKIIYYNSNVSDLNLYKPQDQPEDAELFTRYDAEVICRQLNANRMYGYHRWIVSTYSEDRP